MIEKLVSDKKPSDLREAPVMHYWSLAAGSSAAQKKKLKEIPKSGKYFGSLKKDGAFYKYIKDEDGLESLTSRTKSTKTGKMVDKIDNFPFIVEAMKNIPDGTCFLGEIHFADKTKTSSDVVKISGSLPKKAIERQKKEPLCYYIYDVLAWDGKVMDVYPAEKRLEILEEIKNSGIVNHELVYFAEVIKYDLEDAIVEAINNGEEGFVLYKKDEPYYYKDAPAWTYIKFKKSLVEDLDLVIMGTYPAKKEYSGEYPRTWNYWENLKTGELEEGYLFSNGGYRPVSQYYFDGVIGGFILGLYKSGELVEVARIASLTDEVRYGATDNPEKYIGKVVEVSCMEVLPTGGLRHAKIKKYREDKQSSECTWEKVF